MITIPSHYAYNELLSHQETFVLDTTTTADGERVVLYVKVNPELFSSIINEVPIEIIVRNPKIEQYSITIYFLDIIEAPYYFTKIIENVDGDIYIGISNISLKLFEHKEIVVSLFDELMQNKYGFSANLEYETESFENWFHSTKKHEFNELYEEECRETGFRIKLGYEINKSIRYTNYRRKYEANSDQHYIVSTNKFDQAFDPLNYKGIGKQGYMQEQSLKDFFLGIFIKDVSLFYSLNRPKSQEELTDFLIHVYGVTLLIESKCLRPYSELPTPKRIESSENSLNALIEKGIHQLNRAEDDLLVCKDDESEVFYKGLITNTSELVKLIIVSDTTLINTHKLKELINKNERKKLPIIIGLSDLFFIFSNMSALNCMKLLVDVSDEFQLDETIELPIYKFVK